MKSLAAVFLVGCVFACTPPSASRGTERSREPMREVGDAGHALASTFTEGDEGPLLARPELVAASAALELGDNEKVATLLKAYVDAHGALSRDYPTALYALALVEERLGRMTDAMGHYVMTARYASSLSDYARLGAARAALSLGTPDQALSYLAGDDEMTPLARERRELKVLTLARLGRVEEAEGGLVALRAEPGGYSDSARRRELISAVVSAGASQSPELQRRMGCQLMSMLAELKARPNVPSRLGELERQVLAWLTPEEGRQCAERSPDERVSSAEALVDVRLYTNAKKELISFEGPLPKESTPLTCRAALALGRAELGLGHDDAATVRLSYIIEHCSGQSDLAVRASYALGQRLAQQGKPGEAIVRFTAVESLDRSHRLADDARLRAAQQYLSLGAEAKFTELLLKMIDDYPNGDMTREGVFQLALRRMQHHDWPGALAVLSRSALLPQRPDTMSLSDRESYFIARAKLEVGLRKEGLELLERFVSEHPFSYYMLQAMTRLQALAPERVAVARDAGLARGQSQSFSPSGRSAPAEGRGVRVFELLSALDLQRGQRELSFLESEGGGLDRDVLWRVASFYAAASANREVQQLLRGKLRDWSSQWPVGSWKPFWLLAFPRPYEVAVRREAAQNGLGIELVYAIMREESEFEPTAESPAKAYGLMQLIVPTARRMAKGLGWSVDVAALKKPEINIALGCRMLSKLMATFDSDAIPVIAGYNAGPGRPRRWLAENTGVDYDVWIESIPFSETRNYVKRVLASRAAYALLYEPEQSQSALLLPLKPPVH